MSDFESKKALELLERLTVAAESIAVSVKAENERKASDDSFERGIKFLLENLTTIGESIVNGPAKDEKDLI